MNHQLKLAFAALVFGGCARVGPIELPENHPANPDAAESAYKNVPAAIAEDSPQPAATEETSMTPGMPMGTNGHMHHHGMGHQ